MFRTIVRKCSTALLALTGFMLLYFGLPTTSYACACNGMPSAARMLMIAVLVGAAIIFAAFVVVVIRAGRKGR
jgi:hypothetical protein